MENCVKDIRSWMTNQMLKLNEDKTEVPIIGSKYQPKCQFPSFKIGNVEAKVSRTARNIGVVFDDEVLLGEHIKYITKQAFYNIRNISKIRKFLTEESTKTVVHALVISRMDFCNSLLYGLPKKLLKKIQMIQNTAARLVYNCNRYDHITSVLKQLHRLPVEKRIEFKIIIITFKALHGLAPAYISSLLHFKDSNVFLRSFGMSLLKVPATRQVTYGDRCFQKAAPLLWHALPRYLRLTNDLELFKSKLKTYLFTQAYT